MQLTLTVEFDHVVKHVVQAVHDYGEYHRDDLHQYFRSDGSPACLVGAVLAAEGLTLDDLGEALNASSISELEEAMILDEMDGKTNGFLHQLQSGNDRGHPWIEVFEEALDLVGESLETIGYREVGK